MTAKTLSEIAHLCGAVLEGDGARTVTGPASLAEATSREISFLANPKYRSQLEGTAAAAVLLVPEIQIERDDLALLRCADPNAAFTQVVRAFAADDWRPEPGVHPTAVIDESVKLGRDVAIGAQCVVGPGTELGDGVCLHPGVVLGSDCCLGAGSEVHANVTLYARVTLGERCILHSGCVIGADGFGFDPSPQGWIKVPQCGSVEIGDDVEIGSNTTIDRGRFGATRIGSGTKIDNLVHLGHNVEVGEQVLLVAQAGISGSSRIGSRAVLGGQVGVSGHTTVGEGARVAGGSGIFGDLAPGGEYLGWPARPRREALKRIAMASRVPKLIERVEELERKLKALEGGGS